MKIVQVRRWLKTEVCSLPKAIDGGWLEIISRIRKMVWAWRNGRLAHVPAIGSGIWSDLLVNYILRYAYCYLIKYLGIFSYDKLSPIIILSSHILGCTIISHSPSLPFKASELAITRFKESKNIV